MPSVTTSVTSEVQSLQPAGAPGGGSAATAPAARTTSPPMEWPISATSCTGTGHCSTTRCISEVSATPFSRTPRPVFTRSSSGVQPRAASASG